MDPSGETHNEEVEEAAPVASRQLCHFCRKDLDPEAIYCTNCEQFQPSSPRCVACRQPISAGAAICTECNAYQRAAKSCRSCGCLIPREATVCRQCRSAQGIRGLVAIGQLTLSLMLSLVAVTAAVGPSLLDSLFDSSKTNFLIIQFDETDDSLVILATNSGRRPSYLKKVVVDLGGRGSHILGLDIKEKPSERAIEPGKPRVFTLSGAEIYMDELNLTRKGESESDKDKEWLEFFGGSSMKIEIVGTNEEPNLDPITSNDLISFLWKWSV